MTQEEAISILKTGSNVFLTGEPGSGKTHTVNIYIQYLREHDVGVAITASTGIAATYLGGMTIHSWSGIGIKKSLTKSDLANLQAKHRLVSRAQKTSVLIIDEISMLDAKTLEAVDMALKTLRENNDPFGGMQVVFVGDFFQLPPVVRSGEEFPGFAFESQAWNNSKPVICYLTEQHRHKDIKFVSILSAIRKKDNLENAYAFLTSRKLDLKYRELTTRLYSHNVDVDRVNNEKLGNLPGEEYEFQMTSLGAKPLVEQLIKSCLSPEILILKKGARVMFTKNSFEEGFVNGTLGEITGFDDEAPVVLTNSGRKITVSPAEWGINDGLKILASISQLPLRLAWAITVHKSQGMTLDSAVIDLSQAFEYGQGYVALSRLRSLSGLFLLGINNKALEVHPDVSRVDHSFRERSEKAEIVLNRYSESELISKHNDFILKCGGGIEKISAKSNNSTYEQTLEIYKTGKNILEIANERNLKEGTIISHLEKLKDDKKLTTIDLERIVPEYLEKELPIIHKAFYEIGSEKLSPIFSEFNGKYSYDELRVARLLLKVLS